MSISPKVFFCVIVVIFTAACTRHSAPSNSGVTSESAPPAKQNQIQGGQDGGGGFVNYSSAEQVKEVIQIALTFAKQSDFTQNVFYQFASSIFQQIDLSSTDDEILMTVTGDDGDCVFNHQVEDGIQDAGTARRPTQHPCESSNEFRHHFQNLVSSSHIEIRETGDCGRSGEEVADASVSQFHPGANICFSVDRLRRVPPMSLIRETMALLFHETMHLSGFGEDDAREAQVEFGQYYDSRLGGVNMSNFADDLGVAFGNLVTSIRASIQVAQSDPHLPQVWIYLSRVLDILNGLPYWKDNLALRFASPSSNPNALVAYSFSIAKIVNKLDPSLSCSKVYDDCYSKAKLWMDLDHPESKKKLIASLFEIYSDLNAISDNFKYLTDGTGTWNCQAFDSASFDQLMQFNPGASTQMNDLLKGSFGYPIHYQCKDAKPLSKRSKRPWPENLSDPASN